MNQTSPDRSLKFLIAIVALMAIAVGAFIGWTRYDAHRNAVQLEAVRNQTQLADQAKLDHERLKEWPNQPPGPLPKLEPLPLNLFPIPATRDPEALMRHLIARHPSPKIHQQLLSLLNSGGMSIDLFNADRKVVGQFRTVDPRAAPTAKPDANGRIRVFGLNRNRLASMVSERDVLVMETFVYHEWLHYEQYFLATLNKNAAELETFIGDEVGQYSPESCEYFWKHEHDAWRDTCLFAIQIGVVDYFDRLCLWVGDETAFKQARFNYTPDHTVTPGHPECIPVNAKLAGHPHPEVFQ